MKTKDYRENVVNQVLTELNIDSLGYLNNNPCVTPKWRLL